MFRISTNLQKASTNLQLESRDVRRMCSLHSLPNIRLCSKLHKNSLKIADLLKKYSATVTPTKCCTVGHRSPERNDPLHVKFANLRKHSKHSSEVSFRCTSGYLNGSNCMVGISGAVRQTPLISSPTIWYNDISNLRNFRQSRLFAKQKAIEESVIF